MIELLDKARDSGTPILFLDEAVFTFNTFSKKAWSPPYGNITVLDQALRVKT